MNERFHKFLTWCGHPMWGCTVSLLFAPFFVWCGYTGLIWVPAAVLGLIHEGLQLAGIPHEEEWGDAAKDVVDFTIGGLFAAVMVGLCVWLK